MTQAERLLKLKALKDPALAAQLALLERVQMIKGDPGYTPVKGVDYFTSYELTSIISHVQSKVRNGVDGKDGQDGYTPIKGKDYRDGVDGISPSPEIIAQIVLKKLPKPKDGISPSVDEVASVVTKQIQSKPLDKNIVTKSELVEFLRRGGFRGGGGSSSGGGTGTVTSVSVVSANGVSGTVATSTTTPAITLTLGAITPTSVVSSGSITGSNLSGTNTGDQNLFSSVVVSGQPTVTANTTTTALTLVAGTNVTLVTDNTAKTVTISASGGGGTGITWSQVTGTSQTAAVNNGYVLNNAGLVTLTLPATAAIGDIVGVVGKGAGGWKVAQNAGQTVHFAGQNTTTGVGGSLASTVQYDSLELICITANTDFVIRSSIGNITIV